MQFADVLRTWDECKQSEDYEPLRLIVKTYIQSTDVHVQIATAEDVKSLNSLIAAVFCDDYNLLVRKSILDFIGFIGLNILTRFQLLTSFSILKPLVYGITSKACELDQIKLYQILQLYTLDLHHLSINLEKEMFSCALKSVIRIIHQSKHDNLLEPALGILANLSRFSELVQQTLTKKEDFEALRKCLLRIMSSDQVSQSSLVFSMAVRFYLWKASDKFFEGLNAHKTIQVLFNVLLNGEIGISGLCAGELLGNMCAESQIFTSLISFPELKSCISEIISQLKTKDTSLLLKLLHVLRQLIGHSNQSEIDLFILKQLFCPNTDNKNLMNPNAFQPRDSLLTLFNIMSSSDDLIGSAAVDLFDKLIRLPCCTDFKNDKDQCSLPLDYLFCSSVDSLRKIGTINNLKRLVEVYHQQQSFISSRLVHIQLFLRSIQHLVSLIQSTSFLANNSDVVGQIALLGDFLFHFVNHQLQMNSFVHVLSTKLNTDTTSIVSTSTSCIKLAPDTCLVALAVLIEAMGLLYLCTELLSTSVPSVSQEDEVSLTQPNEGDLNTQTNDLKLTQNVARQCGQSLQTLLERSETPGLLALGLVTSSQGTLTDERSFGISYQTRFDTVRLLGVALQLDKFDTDLLVYNLSRLLNLGGITENDLLSTLSETQDQTPCSQKCSFLVKWFTSPAGGGFHPAVSSSHSHCKLSQQDNIKTMNNLEQKVDAFLTKWNDSPNNQSNTDVSQALSLFEYKIQLLQSRENELESSISANSEALISAHRLCEHYRERAALAEHEACKLRILQLESIENRENDKHTIILCKKQLSELETKISNLNEQLSIQQRSYEELQAKCETLQSKLNTAREHNRAMDVTIDNYRTQLDQAKEQIQSQSAQINKFTQITRLINDLTGNPASDLSTVITPVNPDRPSVITDTVTSAIEAVAHSASVSRKAGGRSTRR